MGRFGPSLDCDGCGETVNFGELSEYPGGHYCHVCIETKLLECDCDELFDPEKECECDRCDKKVCPNCFTMIEGDIVCTGCAEDAGVKV